MPIASRLFDADYKFDRSSLRHYFRNWLLDYKIYLFIFFNGILLTWARPFVSNQIESDFSRFLYWIMISCELYLTVVLVGAILSYASGRYFCGSLKLEVIAYIVVPALMALPARLTFGLFVPQPITLEALVRAYITLVTILPFTVVIITGMRILIRQDAYDRFRGMVRMRKDETSSEIGNARESEGALAASPTGTELAAAANSMRDMPRPCPEYLEANNHHVKQVFRNKVTISSGTLSAHMKRWADQGMRVHKTFWVSWEAIDGYERSGRQMMLKLKSGGRIPVGRTYESKVLAALRNR